MTDAAPTVAELTPGRVFAGRYACARKDRQISKNGSAYLVVELSDRSGTIPARLFREADRVGLGFERGDVIEVRGRVEQFQGRLSVELEAIRRVDPADVDPADFLPSSYRDRDELEGFLEHLTREVHHTGFREVVARLIFGAGSGQASARLTAVPEAFRRAPCSRAGHHAYLGGLLEHTVAVATLVTETCTLHPKLNSDLLMAAALIHDVGKTEEFTYGAELGITERGRTLGHLQLGAELINLAVESTGSLTPEERDSLLSCVMCHHGTDALRLRQFPSAEAIALFRLNALDAQVKGALEHGLN